MHISFGLIYNKNNYYILYISSFYFSIFTINSILMFIAIFSTKTHDKLIYARILTVEFNGILKSTCVHLLFDSW